MSKRYKFKDYIHTYTSYKTTDYRDMIFGNAYILRLDTNLNPLGGAQTNISQTAHIFTKPINFLLARSMQINTGRTLLDLNEQPASCDFLYHNGHSYCIYNDCAENVLNTGSTPLEKVADYSRADATVASLDANGKEKPVALFATDSTQHRSLEIMSGSYDSYAGVYACICKLKHDGKISEGVSWFGLQ